MRLELIPLGAAETIATGSRRLERGEMTIGRDAGCNLVLADETRLVSKIHCRILRDARGFLLRDESVNGVTLRGRELADGEMVRLCDGDEIGLCGHALLVRISGEEEPDWSDPDPRLALGDEMPSITAILADVAPAGRGAGGILPGRLPGDLPEPAERRPRADSLSRPEIGWRGPPPASLLDAVLPDDWNEVSEAGSRNEHVAATGIRMRLPKGSAPAESVPPRPARQDSGDDALLDAFLQGYGAKIEPAGDPRLFMRRMGRALRECVEHHARLDRQLRELAVTEGPARQLDPLDPRPALEAAERDQRRLAEALRGLLEEIDRLAPHVVEARAALGKRPSGWRERIVEPLVLLREGGAAWRSYREAYHADGATPRARFAARLAAAEGEEAEFEELKPDRMHRGATG